jgi:hypothetical protein
MAERIKFAEGYHDGLMVRDAKPNMQASLLTMRV